MVFFLATLVTAAVFITDRMDGVWERTLVAGITTPELLMAHILTQSVIVFLQCTEVIFFIGVVFGTENNGDNLTVIILLSLTGFAGMLFGKCDTNPISMSSFQTVPFSPLLCRSINFNFLRIAYHGQFRVDRSILSNDCALRSSLASGGYAPTIERLCSALAVYSSDYFGKFSATSHLPHRCPLSNTHELNDFRFEIFYRKECRSRIQMFTMDSSSYCCGSPASSSCVWLDCVGRNRRLALSLYS